MRIGALRAAARPAAWRLAARPWPRAGLAGFAGAVAALGLAPWGLWWLTLPTVALALVLRDHAATRGGAFLTGWGFGAGWFGLGLSWIVEPFFVDAARHGWMAPFAVLLLCGGLALFWGAAFALAHRRGGALLVALWVAVEMARGVVFTGFPWAMPGHVFIDTPVAQLAALGGAPLLTLIALGLPAAALAIGRSLWLAIPALACAGAWVALDPGPAPAPDAGAPLVRLVQPNAVQALKWDPEWQPVFHERLMRLTGQGAVPDLVVWPETALPWLLDQSGDALAQGVAAARGAPLALGIQRREAARYYNSAIVVDAAGEIVSLYDKTHLVPFGEYIPFGEIAARFGIHGLAASEGGGYTPGPGLHPVSVPGLGLALPLICYEGIFAREINAAAAPGALRPRLMLLMTNDAWFGTVSGPYQHFAQARLRAIEQRMPMARVANTGVTGMIDAQGRVTARIGLGETGAVDAPLPPRGAAPGYARWGDGPMLVMLLALGLAGMRRNRLDRERAGA
ncbi:apolipoprotein N-acyltransferase [Limimaricola hongkongensis]|uniref:Apolipoprotein N-acyltransferase n=1 Tax=Limimaricola hongkongensis DSM 17492 TaxID=1122180 RepID=A0A017H9I1_9RHOB|nr:apolipoprotein N-acyltransferase [Limimaricola hongkongensis]EYD70813.1 Apolipoprotein N-acyltransferase / Copper homeostasis protein CutE [Limimaricola hongkongensis DSM 17492]